MSERALPSPRPPIPVSSLQYRPRDYFGRYDHQTELLTSVKGYARRQSIKRALELGTLDQIPDYLKAAALDPTDRQMMGRFHPMLMGGEYLPSCKPGEVEIARISIKSTTFDVTVLYARPQGRRIAYRVVDEYSGDTLDEPKTRTSIQPLTMGQMIRFFLGAWDLMTVLQGNFEDGSDGMDDFFNAESEFYPCFDEALREQVYERFPDGFVRASDADD
jgi:hypothetical protein